MPKTKKLVKKHTPIRQKSKGKRKNQMHICHTTLVRIAEATSVIIDEFGGSVNILPLMKALYLADRERIRETCYTITGDSYASLKNGPIPCASYDLAKGSYSGGNNCQELWNEAFSKKGHSISKKGEIISRFSPSQIDTIKRSAKIIKDVFHQGSLSKWMHKECPEWKDPGNSSKPIKIASIALEVGYPPKEAQEIENEIKYMVNMRSFESPCESLLQTKQHLEAINQ
jgi:hypothetical protein